MKSSKQIAEVLPVYSPRSTYKNLKANDEKMIADMTLNFDKLTINLLKEEFEKRDNSLGLEQFIIIAKKHLKFWQTEIPSREIALMRFLTFLFVEIDINGNGDMQWQQFTNYIIEKATVLKNLKSKADEIKNYMKSKVKPKMKIDNIIQKCSYMQDLNKIAFFEEGSSKIHFMNPDNGQIMSKYINIDPKKLVVNISSVKKQKNGKTCIRKKDLVIPTEIRVLDMIYLKEKKYQVLLVSTSDGYIRGWKHSQNGFYLANQPDNEQELFQHYFPSEIYCMAWDHINQVLYCGQKTGNIYMWNLKTDLEKPLHYLSTKSAEISQQILLPEKDFHEEKSNLMITCMITMPKLQFMASGRMDGKLILWDTINNDEKRIYEEHVRGILALAFNEAMILLFSAGFDHKICIWNPYIRTLIHRIEGHLAPILSLQVIEGTHQLISVDSEGIVKITDTRRFNFIYSFSVESSEDGNSSSSLSSLMIINKPLKLVFSGRSIYIYEYDKNYHPFTADENTAICCKYIKEKLLFFTPMGNKIKLWSALNGDVQRIYMDITPHEISTFSFDFLRKRMIVGDTKGNITLHNTANGAKMKTLSKHNGEITHLLATQTENSIDIFISCGLDNEIRIFKETEQSYEIIRTIYIIKEVSVTCLDYCASTRLIIVGSNVGTMGFYDIQTGKLAGTCLNRSYEEFTSISKTNQSIIITASSSGKISVIAMPPLPNRFQKIFSFFHEDPEKPGSCLGVRSIGYSNTLKRLYLIDDKMFMFCYCFKDIEDKNEEGKCINEKVIEIRRSMVSKIFQTAEIKILWKVKVHNEVVKSMEYIEGEQLLVTTSFDKKVKIWSAITGEFIDSLQQNYNKSAPVPIGYYNPKKSLLYSSDLKKIKEIQKIDPIELQYNPFVFNDILKYDIEFAPNRTSNSQWKVYVDFREIAIEQMLKFRKEALQLMQKEKEMPSLSKSNSLGSINSKIKDKKQYLLEQKKKLKHFMQGLQKQNQGAPVEVVEAQEQTRRPSKCLVEDEKKQFDTQKQIDELYKEQCMQAIQSSTEQASGRKSTLKRKVSNTYFKKSILKCIQNYMIKKQNESLAQKSSKVNKKKIERDFVPIYQILKNREKTKNQIEKHKVYIDKLYKNSTESFRNWKNEDKIVLPKNSSESVLNFYNKLKNLDEEGCELGNERKGNQRKPSKRSQRFNEYHHENLPQLSEKQNTLPKIL